MITNDWKWNLANPLTFKRLVDATAKPINPIARIRPAIVEAVLVTAIIGFLVALAAT